MGKNRRRYRGRHLVTVVPTPLGVAFVVAVSLALAYLWMGHKCSQYNEEIKQQEAQCTELENDRAREEARWNAMKRPEQLDGLLVRNGLLMVYPNAAQIVRVSGATQSLPPGAAALAGGDAVRGATRVAGGRTAR